MTAFKHAKRLALGEGFDILHLLGHYQGKAVYSFRSSVEIGSQDAAVRPLLILADENSACFTEEHAFSVILRDMTHELHTPIGLLAPAQ